MRAWALATVLGLAATAGPAVAETWMDPEGNLAVNAPRGWTIRPLNVQGGSGVLAFTASSDCYFFGIPNPATANASVNAARNSTDPLAETAWITALQATPDFMEGGAATVTTHSVDTNGFWPVQRAQLQSGSRTIHGVVQVRPGVELRGFCAGGDASYDAILNGLGHPNDEAWQAAAAAPPETPAAAPAQ